MLLPALGNIMFERDNRSFRFMSFQAENMSTTSVRDVKVKQITALTNRYGVDMVNLMELGLNHGNMPSSASLASFFDAEVELWYVSGFN